MNKNKFRRKLLATAIASCSILGTSMALAAETPEDTASQEQISEAMGIEEIEVVGIRRSLIQAVDRKRDAYGVVDAITAEDIGKFPDGNLAESLQRITGVSIDRSNGEGSKITVRGMGPEFNLVTLNGRQMPTTGDRSFDFANLASEGISAVEVYKTAKATLPGGGIGATVNMETVKPLNDPGLKASISTKAVHETSTDDGNGDEFTPEIAGIFSNTFADDTIGISFTGSYQDRDNYEQNANVDNWIPNVGTGSAVIEDNNQREDGYTWYPQNAGYGVADISRQRTNGQLTLQWAPSDKVTATLDYTYSKVESEKDFNAFGVWFNNGGSTVSGTVNENGTYTRVAEAGGDFATNVGRGEDIKENKSLGINLEWQATDNLKFVFDAHDSSALSEGAGLGNDAFLIIGNTFCGWCGDVPGAGPSTASIDVKTAEFGSSGIPIWDLTLVDGAGNPQDELTGADIGSLFGGVTQDHDENEMTQFQFSGTWTNEDDGALRSIDFGASRTEMDFKSTSANSGLLPAGWWNWSAQYWPDDQWVRASTSGLLDGFSNGGNIPVGYYYTQDFDYIRNGYETIEDTFAPGCCYSDSWGPEFNGQLGAGPIDSDARVNEVVTALFTQLTFADEFNGIPFSVVAGLRYEEGEVKSKGLETRALDVIWTGGNEFSYVFADEQSFSDGSGESKEFLPSLDVSMEVAEGVMTRFSYSRSMTRPNIGNLGSTTTFDGIPKVNQRKINVGNPELKPYLSDNFDFSLEYYYGQGSYVSAGYFKKIVDNFLVTTTTQETVDGLRDVYAGPRAEEARAQLEAEGIQATDPAVFARINENMGVTDLTTPIAPNADDPLIVFDVTRQNNAETANLFGWEFALQHMFGDSGWGVLVNATIVNGDVEADPNVTDKQFALPGMSDSANVSVFYENDNFSARVAYNWRDEFLSGFDQHSSPVFTEEYSQVDANVSYNVNDNFTVFAEALNITEEVQRTYVRFEEQLLRANQYGARINIGARYTF